MSKNMVEKLRDAAVDAIDAIVAEAENLADQLHETVAKVEKEQKGAKEWA